MNDANLRVNEPVFCKETEEQFIKKKIKSRRVATYVSGSLEKSAYLIVRSLCINCGENHQLDSCLKFIGIALKDRIIFPPKKKYFFGCLEPMKPQYNPKICNERFNCRTCGGGNSKAMHGYIPKRKRDDVQDGQLKEEVYHQ